MTLMGEFLKTAEKNKGAMGNPGGQGAPLVRCQTGTAQALTLAESGITKKESSAAQALADMKHNAPELHAKMRAAGIAGTDRSLDANALQTHCRRIGKRSGNVGGNVTPYVQNDPRVVCLEHACGMLQASTGMAG